jgi:hypothetical protein
MLQGCDNVIWGRREGEEVLTSIVSSPAIVACCIAILISLCVFHSGMAV